MKYLLVILRIRNDYTDCREVHLISTKCNSIDYAAEYFAAHYFEGLVREPNGCWGDDLVSIRVIKAVEIEKEYWEYFKNIIG